VFLNFIKSNITQNNLTEKQHLQIKDVSRISFIDGLEISCMKALVFYRFSTGILKSIICNRHGLKWSNSMAIFQSNLVQYILCSSFLRSQI